MGAICRFPRGKRGLKLYSLGRENVLAIGRFPRGKRGLKFNPPFVAREVAPSLPPREAWIEIENWRIFPIYSRSLPPREAWIEIALVVIVGIIGISRFPRGKRGLK